MQYVTIIFIALEPKHFLIIPRLCGRDGRLSKEQGGGDKG